MAKRSRAPVSIDAVHGVGELFKVMSASLAPGTGAVGAARGAGGGLGAAVLCGGRAGNGVMEGGWKREGM